MHMIRLSFTLVSMVLLYGCGDALNGNPSPDIYAVQDEREPGTPLEFYTESETGLAYAETDTSAQAWIFLVAGSLRGANFAQEVIEQKRMWLARGAEESEIACYFVVPDKNNFDEDADQYRELADELRACKLANVGAIARDMARAAATSPENVYLYVTSHGDRPLSYHADTAENESDRAFYEMLTQRYPFLDRHMIAIDSTPEGSATISNQLDAVDAGTPADQIFLTPTVLNSMLAAYAPEVTKTVVLQGCYSGGFIEALASHPDADLLTATPQITVLTAARNDRPSFGCGLAARTTYFGGALLDTLADGDALLPDALDWQSVYRSTREKIARLEEEQGFRPSEPRFFTNQR